MNLKVHDGESGSASGGVPGIGCDPDRSADRADSTVELLRCNSSLGLSDLQAIEARARALRAAAIGELLSRFWNWIEARLYQARRRREEAYLARAQNLVELEQRLRKLEREGQVMHI